MVRFPTHQFAQFAKALQIHLNATPFVLLYYLNKAYLEPRHTVSCFSLTKISRYFLGDC